MKLPVKADKALFDRWNEIGQKIALQRSIVQNDMEIDTEELKEWMRHTQGLVEEMGKLILETSEYVMNGGGHEDD